MRAAKPLSDTMSLDEYMNVAEVWDTMPGEEAFFLSLSGLIEPVK